MILEQILAKYSLLQKFIAVVGIQLLVLLLIISLKSYTILSGETVTLKVLPVDPHDLLRGEYVHLRYGISSINLNKVKNDLADKNDKSIIVYITLKNGPDGYHLAKSISSKRPANGLYIKGKVYNRNTGSVLEPVLEIAYGIEDYYVEQGKGRAIEDAINKNEVLAKVKVDKFGNGVIEDLMITDKKVDTPVINTEPVTSLSDTDSSNPFDNTTQNLMETPGNSQLCMMPFANAYINVKANDVCNLSGNLLRVDTKTMYISFSTVPKHVECSNDNKCSTRLYYSDDKVIFIEYINNRGDVFELLGDYAIGPSTGLKVPVKIAVYKNDSSNINLSDSERDELLSIVNSLK